MPAWVSIVLIVVIVLAGAWMLLRKATDDARATARQVSEQIDWSVDRARRRGEAWAQPRPEIDPQAHLVSGKVERLVGHFGTSQHSAARAYLLGAFEQGMGRGSITALTMALGDENPQVRVTAVECLVAHAERFGTHRDVRRALKKATKDPVTGDLARSAMDHLAG